MSEKSSDEDLFARAVELPKAERAAFLDRACAGDDAQRARVESLLRAHDAAGDFLTPPTIPQPQTTPGGPAFAEEQLGKRIGRYKLLQKIGEGGCGVVYMAEQVEPVRRRTALKVIKLGMDTKQVVARFEAERQALALMDHPNIAKVFDGGATETGRPYFVMELVRGVRITEYCDVNSLSTGERLKLFIPVCHAVQHAHQKGIIHRDLKPSNVLVTSHDGVAVPKVIDFGIAKATQGRLTDKTVFTAFEQFIGTPAYMSPEQAEMSGLDIDTRSDIYSLGVLLYELLTGKTPFDAQELIQAGLAGITRMIREKEPIRPSTRLSSLSGAELGLTARLRSAEPPKLINLVRGDLDWVVMKCLEKDRTRRYETANGLAMDLQRHLGNEPVAARPPSTIYRLQKMVRRNKLAVTAAAIVTVSLVGGLGISTVLFLKEREAHRLAQSEAAKSRQVAQFLEDMLDGVTPSVARGEDTTMLTQILDKTIARVGTDLNDQPEVKAELQNTIGRVYFALGQYDKAAAIHREALAIRQALYPGDNPAVADSLNNLALVLHHQNELAESEKMYLDAVAMRKRLYPDGNPDVADSLNYLADTLTAEGKPAEAETRLREALAMENKLVPRDDPGVADSLGFLGLALREQHKWAEAESVFRQALALRQKLFPGDHPDVTSSLNTLALVLYDEGKPAEAETYFRESLAMRQRLLPPNHPDLARSLDHLGMVLNAQGRFAEAETMYRQELSMLRNQDSKDPDILDPAVIGLVDVLHKQDRPAEASALLKEAADLGSARFQNELAWLYATSPDPTVQDRRLAVDYATKAVAATSRKNAEVLDTLAAADAEAGNFSDAVDVEQEAIALEQDETTRGDFESRLKLFESHVPYREPAAASR